MGHDVFTCDGCKEVLVFDISCAPSGLCFSCDEKKDKMDNINELAEKEATSEMIKVIEQMAEADTGSVMFIPELVKNTYKAGFTSGHAAGWEKAIEDAAKLAEEAIPQGMYHISKTRVAMKLYRAILALKESKNDQKD